jgi:hypothetical protein
MGQQGKLPVMERSHFWGRWGSRGRCVFYTVAISPSKTLYRTLKVSHALRRAPLEERKKRKRPDEADAPPTTGPVAPTARNPKPAPASPGSKPSQQQARPNPTPLPVMEGSPQTVAGAFREAKGREGVNGAAILGGKTRGEKLGGPAPAQGIKHKNVRTVALGGVSEEAMGKALELAEAAGKVCHGHITITSCLWVGVLPGIRVFGRYVMVTSQSQTPLTAESTPSNLSTAREVHFVVYSTPGRLHRKARKR